MTEFYGGEEAHEINSRTSCTQYSMAHKDVVLDTVPRLPLWGYLTPLKRLKLFYAELKCPQYHLRQKGSQRNIDGSFPKNPLRMGPYTMERAARNWCRFPPFRTAAMPEHAPRGDL